jgi:malonate transporter and related proteins
METFFRTAVPIIFLIATGYSSRKFKLLDKNGIKVFANFVYYYALPALLLVTMAKIPIRRETFTFIFAAYIPHFIAFITLTFLYIVFKFSRSTYFLLLFCTLFGSHTFYGLPFIMFAYDTPEANQLAALSSSFLAISSVFFAITILEMHKVQEAGVWDGIRVVIIKLSKNPLIISILGGLLLSVSGIKLPLPLERPLTMLGRTAGTLAIVQIGATLYGRKYEHLSKAFLLCLTRMLFLPLIAFFILFAFFKLTPMENTVLILMHATPVALSTIILSERYNFHTDVIPSLMLISSIGASIYMNVWLLIATNI